MALIRSGIRLKQSIPITQVVSKTFSAREIPSGFTATHPVISLTRSFSYSHILQTSTTESKQNFKEQPRVNPVGIQYLSTHLDKQIFPTKYQPDSVQSTEDPKLIELSKRYLDSHKLLGKKTNISEPISFDLPELQGENLDEHFKKLAIFSSKDYIKQAKDLAELNLPPKPDSFLLKSGWYRYEPGKDPNAVDFPEDDALVFDVETQYKVSHYPLLAIAASVNAWYCWVSPLLTHESKSYEHLVPLDTLNSKKVIVGHNIGYDRARIKEEYDLKETKAFFLDTMSLHIAVSGMCSQQRIRWMHHRKLKNDEDVSEEDVLESEMNDPWVNYSSPNSLAEVAQFYMKEDLDKSTRDLLAEMDLDIIRDNFDEVVNYCAKDVGTTHKIYQKTLPEFLQVCPHPVSFAGLRHMSSGILPTDSTWYDYISISEKMYIEGRNTIEAKLNELANEAVELRFDLDKAKKDPWLSQLDWEITEQKFKKDGSPYKNQKLPGFPAWYRDLYSAKEGKLIITIRSRLTPLLLRLSWEGHPVIWHDHYGWCFKAPFTDFERLRELNYIDLPHFEKTRKLTKEEFIEMGKSGEFSKLSKFDEAMFFKEDLKDNPVYFRVPNSIGPEHRTTLLMAKEFSTPFEKGILKSDNPLAQDAIKLNASCSYWISSRERIQSQFVVDKPESGPYSLIVPQIVPMGTVTRRAVEKTWLTASNAKKSRIGSELKSKIKAPPGYCFVGADVDSEELWIASLVGDSMFKIHGGTAIGWMTLEGSKNEGTDLHSKTANILGISRNEAKIFNYGRIYGAGVKFAATLLKKFNPGLSQDECRKRAVQLYAETKGSAGKYFINRKSEKLWFGGSESVLFNELERIAHNPFPKTPVLGAAITKALNKSNLKQNSFLTSRVNWAIQSSGVDYLHLLCVSMNYLINKYSIDARLAISVHDEIRYLVKEEDKYRAARALQISNIWTRAIFSENLGMKDLPQSCAFFSAVDVDSVLRKEVDMDCITPSHPVAIPPGESLDILKLLSLKESSFESDKGKELGIDEIDLAVYENPASHEDQIVEVQQDSKYTLGNPEFKETLVKMQICSSENDLKNIWRSFNRPSRKQEDTLNIDDLDKLNRDFENSVSLPEPATVRRKTNKEINDEMLIADMEIAMNSINYKEQERNTNSGYVGNAEKEAQLLADLRTVTSEENSEKFAKERAKKIIKNFKNPQAKSVKSKSIKVVHRVIDDKNSPTKPATAEKKKLSKEQAKRLDEEEASAFLESLIGKDGKLKKAENAKLSPSHRFPTDFSYEDYGVKNTTTRTPTKVYYKKYEKVPSQRTINIKKPGQNLAAEKEFHNKQENRFYKRVIDV